MLHGLADFGKNQKYHEILANQSEMAYCGLNNLLPVRVSTGFAKTVYLYGLARVNISHHTWNLARVLGRVCIFFTNAMNREVSFIYLLKLHIMIL